MLRLFLISLNWNLSLTFKLLDYQYLNTRRTPQKKIVSSLTPNKKNIKPIPIPKSQNINKSRKTLPHHIKKIPKIHPIRPSWPKIINLITLTLKYIINSTSLRHCHFVIESWHEKIYELLSSILWIFIHGNSVWGCLDFSTGYYLEWLGCLDCEAVAWDTAASDAFVSH